MIGNTKLKDVRDTHLQKILSTRQGYSLSNVTKLMNTIKAMFKQARISRLISYDPAEALSMPKTTQGTRRAITDSERAMILKTAETHYAGLMFLTMLYCGLRPGEIRALQWGDIDFERQVIKVTKAIESGSNIVKAPKTFAGNREVPIPNVLFSEYLRKKGNPTQTIFTQLTTDNPHTENSFSGAWLSFLRAMDIEHGAVVYRN